MTPKEKAKELVSKFNNSYDKESKSYILYQNVDESKRCALIAVEMVILNCYEEEEYYWQEVKQEIEKL